LPATTTCEVRVISANVRDTDSNDPPDNMAVDYIFDFTTLVDAAPQVDPTTVGWTSTGSNTANLTVAAATQPTITVAFTEAVDLATGALTLVCNAAPVTISTAPALPILNQTSINITSLAEIAEGANCTLNVVAANVSDSDMDDPPNLMATD